MNPRPLLALALGGATLSIGLASRPRSSSAEAASAASPSASAAPAAAPDAGGALPRFDAEPFGEQKSPPPTAAEWKPAEPITLTEPLPEPCRAYRLREWVKIRCSPFETSAIALLAGEREGVSISLDPLEPFMQAPKGGEVLFPVRRGGRRVFEWSTFGEAYEGPGFPEVAFMISESWAPRDPGPTIIMMHAMKAR